MKNLLILTTVAAILFFGCSKEKGTEVPQNFKQTDLENLNKYRPNEDKLASVYHSFVKEIKPNAANYKSGIDPVDRPLDEAVWLLDVTTNTELGFKNDSIEELFIDTLTIVLNNKSFTAEDIPIIDGDEIVSVYTDFKNSVEQNSNQGFLLWATKVNATSISADESEIEIITAGGSKGAPGYWKLLPPGEDPDPFPSGSYFTMAQSAIQYNIRCHETEYSYLGPGWTIESSNFFGRSWWNGGNIDNRVAHGAYTCSYGPINLTTLNNFLFSTKDVIDQFNPNGYDNKVVGYFNMYCFNFDPPISGNYSEHILEFYIYKITYIGDPS